MPQWLIINLVENIAICAAGRLIQHKIKPCDCAVNVYSISYMRGAVCLDDWAWFYKKKKKKTVCGWHKITYLSAPASAVDNQRLSDNAECPMWSVAWETGLYYFDCVVTQLALNPRKSGTFESGWSQMECCLLPTVCQSAYCQSPHVYTICLSTTCSSKCAHGPLKGSCIRSDQ